MTLVSLVLEKKSSAEVTSEVVVSDEARDGDASLSSFSEKQEERTTTSECDIVREGSEEPKEGDEGEINEMSRSFWKDIFDATDVTLLYDTTVFSETPVESLRDESIAYPRLFRCSEASGSLHANYRVVDMFQLTLVLFLTTQARSLRIGLLGFVKMTWLR